MDFFRDNIYFKYSSDIQFYGCNFFHRREKLSNIGIDLPLNVDESHKKFCLNYYQILSLILDLYFIITVYKPIN